MNCRKCLHFLVCTYNDKSGKEFDCSQAENCPFFRNRYNFIELPCEIGQTVYCIRYDKARKPFVKPLGVCSVTVWGKGGLTVFTTKEDSWGVTAFATPEEAEAKLREMKGDNDEQRKAD